MAPPLRGTEDKPWWHEGLKFECIRCGRCCRGEPGAVWFSPEEGKKISDYLGISEEEFYRLCVISRLGRHSLRERPNGDCAFLNPQDNSCSIYPVRPIQCALYPFWPSILTSRRIWQAQAKRCPGIDMGRLYSQEEISSLLRLSPFPDL
ncbi:YkgJ family cysteine cluster protein [Acetomicrobium sp. S15 = DSM 107314]|uniref:YkgJ family cysteine cluster protein n=1 Tax=Acetomicrobium sp. S15 = DSM 107314 TaxID=2529858 RepID=UPI0018E105FF